MVAVLTVDDQAVFRAAARKVIDATPGFESTGEAASGPEALEPGSAAVMIVYENRWAGPFAAAVRRNGGVVIDNQRIPVQDVIDALDAVEATA